jgi:hypothetical protein
MSWHKNVESNYWKVHKPDEADDRIMRTILRMPAENKVAKE